MPETVVRVGDKKPPMPGKKRWKVVSFNNEVFQVNADIAPLFLPGKSYKVFYENQEFEGRKFTVIVRAPEETPEVSTGMDYEVSKKKTDDSRFYQSPDRQEVIWCCAMLKEEIRSGRVSAHDAIACLEVVKAQIVVYGRAFGNLAEKEKTEDLRTKDFPEGYKTPSAPKASAYKPGVPTKTDPDFDDEIPFN